MSAELETRADDIRALTALLEWYVEAGVDLAQDDAPHDHFAESAAQLSRRMTAASEAVEQRQGDAGRMAFVAPASPDDAVMSAREKAAKAQTLDELRDIMQNFEGCSLKQSATRLVFADGNPQARVMFVGEAPGRDEDEVGRPFVGRSGKLLDRMLAAIGLDRTSVYIANVIPWRPPGNRTPTPQEIAICKPFITRQIELINPAVLVCLGGPAAQTILEQRDGILKMRGRWIDLSVDGRSIPALATLHPAYLLRQPAQKRLAWRDLRALKARLATI